MYVVEICACSQSLHESDTAPNLIHRRSPTMHAQLLHSDASAKYCGSDKTKQNFWHLEYLDGAISEDIFFFQIRFNIVFSDKMSLDLEAYSTVNKKQKSQ